MLERPVQFTLGCPSHVREDALVLWVALLVLMLGSTIWGLSRLPRKHRKGEEPVTRDGGSFGEPGGL